MFAHPEGLDVYALVYVLLLLILVPDEHLRCSGEHWSRVFAHRQTGRQDVNTQAKSAVFVEHVKPLKVNKHDL